MADDEERTPFDRAMKRLKGIEGSLDWIALMLTILVVMYACSPKH